MGLILLGGIDRTGKTTVASFLEKRGYVSYHMSAPDKKYYNPDYSGPSYVEEYIDLLMSFQGKDVVMDRFWDGELVWPHIYGRKPLLSEEDIEVIREIEKSMDVEYVILHDPNTESHWQRCVDNKEPLTKAQFLKAKALYDKAADKYSFQKRTMFDMLPESNKTKEQNQSMTDNEEFKKPPELAKLDKANAINDVLSRRLLKSKGPVYDDLESDIRNFLMSQLSNIFNNNPKDSSFSKEELLVLKTLVKKIKEKENK
jgi:thymidylate kinase